jgi:hypothetical protein
MHIQIKSPTLPSILCIALVACGDSTPNDSTPNDDATSSIQLQVSGADFSGNSIRICGARQEVADAKYACDSDLLDTSDECPCFDFNADGTLVTPGGAAVTGLCPSVNVPQADWAFSYELFSAPGCQGTQLNDGANNFTCFDSRDLASQAHPNQSIEALAPGPNVNHVLCLTTNASKDWSFATCSIETTTADTVGGHFRLDCGCTPTDGACDCPGGLTAGDLEDLCSFESTTCNILCGPGVPDLSVQISGPNQVEISETGVYTVEITNLGTGPNPDGMLAFFTATTEIQVIPPGSGCTYFVSPDNPGGTSLLCPIATIPPGASQTLTFDLSHTTPTSAAESVIAAVGLATGNLVLGVTGEVNINNNLARQDVNFNPAPTGLDLAPSVSGPNSLPINTPGTYTITVAAFGDSTDGTLLITVPAFTSVISAPGCIVPGPPGGSSPFPTVLTCFLPPLSNSMVTYLVTFFGTNPHFGQDVSATVSGVTGEVYTDNNFSGISVGFFDP